MNADRLPPHSIEAEEYLLSCCLLDGSDSIAKCIDEGMTGEEFYSPANQVIFRKTLELYRTHPSVTVAVLAEELKAAGQLESLGGLAYLTQITGRVPTTAQVQYWINKVLEYHVRRELIAASARIAERSYAGDGDRGELIALAERDLACATDGDDATPAGQEMKWDALLGFDAKADADCLMGNRFLGRCGALVIVAPSGVGKSVLAMQLGACAALGESFFGLRMIQPMRVLYVQAEDDVGDVAESAQGFRDGYRLADTQLAQLRERFRIVRWNDAAGHKFLSRLRREHRKWSFDLVIINPLFSFAGCNVSEQRELSPFLRNGLNPILNETRSAAVVIHHTNKPPSDPNVRQADANAELRYLGSGSAELTNWARAYITLQGVKAAGDKVYKMAFAKRGLRAGIADENGKPTTSIFIEHADRGLCWVPSSYRPDATSGGKFKAKFNLNDARRVYDRALPWRDNEATIAAQQGMSGRAIRGYRDALEAAA